MEFFVMLISSDSFYLSVANVYQVVDSYLNFEENTLQQLLRDGIDVHLSYAADSCLTEVRVDFRKSTHASICNDIVSELHELVDAIDRMYESTLDESNDLEPAMLEWIAERCYTNAKELLESLGGSVTFIPNEKRSIGSDYYGWFKIMVPEHHVSKFKIDHRYPGSFMLNNQ
jgi:hypothetical protein